MTTAADIVIEKCGGHAAVAGMLGAHLTTVYRWTYPVQKGGTGGVIPARHQSRLLEEARRRGISLEPADFFPPVAGPDVPPPPGDEGHRAAPAPPAAAPAGGASFDSEAMR